MSLLRKSLFGNGLFSVVSGLIAIVFSDPLSEATAVSRSVLYVVGVGVFVFGAVILWVVRGSSVDLGFALFVVAADLVWVLAAVVLITIPATMSGTGRLIFGGVTVVVALLAALQTRGLIAASREEPRRLVTEVHINNTPDKVWASLTDLLSYQDWNPFITSGQGEVNEGSALKMRMESPGGSAMTFTPTVTRVEAARTFEWLGSVGVAGVFDGRHRFDLEPTEHGTRLSQSEEFTGILVPILWRSLDTKTRAGFETMNLALKTRVEDGVRNPT